VFAHGHAVFFSSLREFTRGVMGRQRQSVEWRKIYGEWFLGQVEMQKLR
jgi:hypothetical protein